MKLSRHFWLAEMTASEAARDLGDSNQPTAEHLALLPLPYLKPFPAAI